jgi:hypothetical protein
MRFRRRKFDSDAPPNLEARVTHLESMIEGLQDAVHRQTVRLSERLDEVEKRIEPAELSRALSQDARERGL